MGEKDKKKDLKRRFYGVNFSCECNDTVFVEQNPSLLRTT